MFWQGSKIYKYNIINIIIERGTLRMQKNDEKLLTYAGFKWSRRLAIFGMVVGKG